MLGQLKGVSDPRVIVGFETADDAAVIRLDDARALVQTVDFITPVLDDPFLFGAVAAANSLSDVYAMGGTPLTALNLVCFPEGDLEVEVLGEVLRGGASKCAEAGCLLVGGHSVKDPEFKFGLSVTGLVHPERVLRNSTARPGHDLVLTKPLGTGILATALKRGKLPAAEREALTRSMVELNARAATVVAAQQPSAVTDVTGFGLAGHGAEMARGAGVRLVLELSRLPVLPGAIHFARRGFLTGGDRRNRDYVGDLLRISGGPSDPLAALAFDAQTSGGLLAAIPRESTAAVIAALPGAAVIGRVEEGPAELVLSA